MSAYAYLTTDNVVSGRPCVLLSVTVGNDGGNSDTVVIYNEKSAASGQEVATLVCGGNTTTQVRFQGLELDRGLYLDLGSNIEYVMVEWEPISNPEEEKPTAEHIIAAHS